MEGESYLIDIRGEVRKLGFSEVWKFGSSEETPYGSMTTLLRSSVDYSYFLLTSLLHCLYCGWEWKLVVSEEGFEHEADDDLLLVLGLAVGYEMEIVGTVDVDEVFAENGEFQP